METAKMVNEVHEEIDVHKCLVCHTVISGLESFISHGRMCTWENYNGTFTFENPPKLRLLGMPPPAEFYRSSPTASFSSGSDSDFDQINENIRHYCTSLLSDDEEDCSTENDKIETSARSIDVGTEKNLTLGADEGDDDESVHAMEEKERFLKESLKLHDYVVAFERSNELDLGVKEACEDKALKFDCPNLMEKVSCDKDYAASKKRKFPSSYHSMTEDSDANTTSCTGTNTSGKNVKRKLEYIESESVVSEKDVSGAMSIKVWTEKNLTSVDDDDKSVFLKCRRQRGKHLLTNPLGEIIGRNIENVGSNGKVPLVKTNSTLNIGHLGVDPEVATSVEAEINVGRGRGMKRGRGRPKRGRGRWRGGRGRGCRLDIQEKRFVEVGSSEYSENGAEAMRGVETKVRRGRGRGKRRGQYRGRGYQLSKALKNVENVIEYVVSNACKESGYLESGSDDGEKEMDSVFTALATSSKGRIIRKPVRFLPSVTKRKLPEEQKVCQTKTTPGLVLETEKIHSKKAKRITNLVAVNPVCDIHHRNSSSCSKQTLEAESGESQPTLEESCSDPSNLISDDLTFAPKERNSSCCSKQTLEAESGESQPTLEEICSDPLNLISDDLTFAPKESSITELNVCNMDTYTEKNSPTRDLADTVVTQSVVTGMSIPTNESFAFDEDSTSPFVIEDIRTITSNEWEEKSLEGSDSSCIIIEDSCVARGIWANSIDEVTKTVSNQISDQEHPTRLSTRSNVNLGFRCDSKEYQQKQNAKLSTACRNSSSSLERINEPPLKDNVSIPTSIDVEPESIENNKLKFQGIFSVDIVKNLQYLKPLFSKLGNNIDFAPSNSGGLVPSVVVLPENRKEKEKSLMIRVDYKKIDSNPMCECICGRKKEFVQQLDLQRQCVLKECQDPSAVDHTWECYLNPNHPNECICDSNKSIPKANSNSDSRSVSECSSTTSLGTAMESCEYNFSGKLNQAIQDNNFIRQTVSNVQCSSSTVSKIGDLNFSKKALDDASSCSSVTDLRKDCWMPSIEMTDLSNIDECAENPEINGSKTIYIDPPILPRRSLRRTKSVDRLTYLREWPVKKTNKPGRKKLTKRRSNCDDGYVSEYTPCDIDSETEDPTYLSQRSRKTKRKHYRKKTSTKKLSTHNDGYVTDYNSCNEDTMDECDFLLERATSISRCELFEKENDKGDNVSDRILRVKKKKFPVYREMPLRRCKSTANINYCPEFY